MIWFYGMFLFSQTSNEVCVRPWQHGIGKLCCGLGDVRLLPTSYPDHHGHHRFLSRSCDAPRQRRRRRRQRFKMLWLLAKRCTTRNWAPAKKAGATLSRWVAKVFNAEWQLGIPMRIHYMHCPSLLLDTILRKVDISRPLCSFKLNVAMVWLKMQINAPGACASFFANGREYAAMMFHHKSVASCGF